MSSHLDGPRPAALAYRADLDGLRAIAVLGVIGFHAWPDWLPGGFVGVDMFFALSGFLITSIIVAGVARGEFSVADFYARRIKRIFPALLVVIASTYAFGCFVLFDDELQQLGRHVAGGAAFVSNLVLWSEAGYFDSVSEAKPLLHLWSLGIEEQFYLLWPWLVLACARTRTPLLRLTLVLGLLSFATGLGLTDSNPQAAFYAPHTRIWELFGGALLAIGQRHRGADDGMHWSLIAARVRWMGPILVVVSMLLFDAFDAFPGWRAALPVIGTLLLIEAGPHAFINRVVLSAAPLRWLGLLSYPLYLWHWPLLAYGRVLGNRALPPGYAALAMLLAVVLAWLSYQWIEKPIRFRWRGSAPVATLVTAMLVMAVIGYGSPAALLKSARAVVSGNRDNQAELAWVADHSPGCVEALGLTPTFCIEYGTPGAPRVMLLGDSSSNAMAPGLGEALAARGTSLLHIGSFSCPPIRGLVESPRWRHGKDCMAAVERAYDIAARTDSVEVVVLVMMARDVQQWGLPGVALSAPPATRFAAMAALLMRDIAMLTAAGKRVIVTYDMPTAPVQARDCLARPFAAQLSGGYEACRLRADELPGQRPYIAMFDQLLGELPKVCVFHQSALLLPDGSLNMFDARGRLLMRDDHHLSLNGSRQMARLLLEHCGPWPAR